MFIYHQNKIADFNTIFRDIWFAQYVPSIAVTVSSPSVKLASEQLRIKSPSPLFGDSMRKNLDFDKAGKPM